MPPESPAERTGAQDGPVKVKICGLTRIEDGLHAAGAGADYLGFIASHGFGRSMGPAFGRRLSDETGVPVVAVTVDEPLEALIRLAMDSGASVLQLHGDEPPARFRDLRERGPWKLWKALRVRTGEQVVDALARYGPLVDALLLDGWHPDQQGGAGVRFPWDVVAPLRHRFPAGLGMVAAGGLSPENVGRAVLELRPHVVDVSSGVERARGIKDPALVQAFIENAKSGIPQD